MPGQDRDASHRPPTLLEVRRVRGGGGSRGEVGVIPGFKFHSVVVAGGGTGERRWGLWELCENKEPRGSPAVCVIAPECIFLFLVMPVSVGLVDDLILSLVYSEGKRTAVQ